jgi:hypothetical protein
MFIMSIYQAVFNNDFYLSLNNSQTYVLQFQSLSNGA